MRSFVSVGLTVFGLLAVLSSGANAQITQSDITGDVTVTSYSNCEEECGTLDINAAATNVSISANTTQMQSEGVCAGLTEVQFAAVVTAVEQEAQDEIDLIGDALAQGDDATLKLICNPLTPCNCQDKAPFTGNVTVILVLWYDHDATITLNVTGNKGTCK